jgi:hypothetical protein
MSDLVQPSLELLHILEAHLLDWFMTIMENGHVVKQVYKLLDLVR